MRIPWKMGIALFILIFLSMALAAQTSQQPVERFGKPIAGAGCVQAGVESGCLLLKDAKTKTLYNLFFKGNKPTSGDAIQFTGTANAGVNTCMQGKSVDVKEWKPIKMRCNTSSNSKKPDPPK
jgi:hypothetical protein